MKIAICGLMSLALGPQLPPLDIESVTVLMYDASLLRRCP